MSEKGFIGIIAFAYSTLIFVALYLDALAVAGAVGFLGLMLALSVICGLLERLLHERSEKPIYHAFDPIHNDADECECGLIKDAKVHQRRSWA